MYFLAAVEINDGEHQHRDWGIVVAQNLGEAEKIVREQVDIDNDHSNLSDEVKYWSYVDSYAVVQLHTIQPLTDNDAKVLQKFGIAYIINPKNKEKNNENIPNN